MESLVRYWIHLTYSRDLQSLGCTPVMYGHGPYDAFLLTHKDWEAFRRMYDPQPEIYEEYPQ